MPFPCNAHGMASVNQTRPQCVNQMVKTHSKPLAAWHGKGKAWARHGHCMLCVNRPLEVKAWPHHLPRGNEGNETPEKIF